MLDSIDFGGKKLSKEAYKEQRKALVEKLVVLQQEARTQEIGMVVLFEGWDGAGKGSRISDLVYDLDARATSVHVTTDVPQEEIDYFNSLESDVTGYYPPLYQFWQALGMQGTITFYDRGWYTTVTEYLLGKNRGIKGKKNKDKNKKLFKNIDKGLATINFAHSIEAFERQLVDDGYIVLKLFLHVSKEAQKQRLKSLYNDPSTKWRVSKKKLKRADIYDDIYPLFDALLEHSNFRFCPWTILNGEDKRATNIKVLEAMIEALQEKLETSIKKKSFEGQLSSGNQAPAPSLKYTRMVDSPPQMDNIVTNLTLSRDEYSAALKVEQRRLGRLQIELYQKRIPLVIMYEGWDAAGKGGNIKRVAQALDARSYTIFPSAAPTKPELLHPFLWRYWTRLPKAGHVGIYDRSWYGRVLVERIEGFASHDEWARAYSEINAFETDLVSWGAILIKFWVNVSEQEQLERFKEREATPEKSWKITEEDWRNREKRPEYKVAIDDMFRLTSTVQAPWIILESDDKLYARIKALKVINNAIERRLQDLSSQIS